MIKRLKFWYHPETDRYFADKKSPEEGCYEITPQQYFAAMHPNLYVFDIESYPNVFTVTVFRPADRGIWRFEISPRVNQGAAFFEFLTALKHSGGRMVGFNNVGYDYPVIHELVKRGGHITAYELFMKGDAIINSQDKFGHMVWESDWYVPQIDLFKIHHFDNKQRGTSLKVLEFNMGSSNIQDLPYQPGVELTLDQIDPLIEYNDWDTFETANFLYESVPMLEFRDELSERYDRNFTNHNDTKIGKDYFVMCLEQSGIECYHRPNGKREPRQTIRPNIPLNDVILPWVNFSNRPFQLVIEWLRNQSITKTKGVFEYLDVTPEMVQYMDHSLIRVHGLTAEMAPKTTPKQRENGVNLSKLDFEQLRHAPVKFLSGWKDQSGLNCMVNGFRYDFGTGGIHGSVESQVVHSDDHYIIIDLDVASYYPNLAIANGFYPAHLSERFCEIYVDVYNQRKGFAKGTPENAMLKLALNGVYGDSNNTYSPFYDPAYTMAITINGQLLLCLLAEYLTAGVHDLQMIQINTDGLTVRCPRSQADQVMFIAKAWEQQTGLELERADYSRMFIRDVNNYIAEYTDGKLKRKGAYCYGDDLVWHQNYSSQVVAIAAEAALVRGVPVSDTVFNHPELSDFMRRTKVPRSSKLVLERTSSGASRQLQNTSRYYISHSDARLFKVMPPTPAQVSAAEFPQYRIMAKPGQDNLNVTTQKQFDVATKKGFVWNGAVGNAVAPDRRIGIDVGWGARECNDLSGMDLSNLIDLNHNYYIGEAEKLVTPLL